MPDARFDMRVASDWTTTIEKMAAPPLSSITSQADPALASRVAIVAELEEARLLSQQLRQALDSTDAARLATRRWSIRDVVAHLASWSQRTRLEADALLGRGTVDEIVPFGVDGPHAWNDRAIEARAKHSLADLFLEIDEEHERLIAIVADTRDAELAREVELPRTIGDPPAPWRRTIGAMILMSCWHARLHLTRLEQLLAQS
jgi:hypothetical protein